MYLIMFYYILYEIENSDIIGFWCDDDGKFCEIIYELLCDINYNFMVRLILFLLWIDK